MFDYQRGFDVFCVDVPLKFFVTVKQVHHGTMRRTEKPRMGWMVKLVDHIASVIGSQSFTQRCLLEHS